MSAKILSYIMQHQEQFLSYIKHLEAVCRINELNELDTLAL